MLDVEMPGRDGIWACREIRERFPGDRVPILVVTGQDLSTAVTMGVIPFLLGDVLKVAVATVIATRIRDRGLQLF